MRLKIKIQHFDVGPIFTPFSPLISGIQLTRIIQSLYYSPAGRYINAWMHSLIKSVKPEIVNRYDLWELRQKNC